MLSLTKSESQASVFGSPMNSMCFVATLMVSTLFQPQGISGQQLNGHPFDQVDRFDSETSAFLDWFYVIAYCLLSYFLVQANQQSIQESIESTLSAATVTSKWASPTTSDHPYGLDYGSTLPPYNLKPYPNHHHQHVYLPSNQLIVNLMPHLNTRSVTVTKTAGPVTPTDKPLLDPWPPSTFPNRPSNPTIAPFNQPAKQTVDHQPDAISGQPRVSFRRHFGAPVPGAYTSDNFDQEKTVNESRAEKMNPLIKVNVKIRENIKGLRDLETTYQRPTASAATKQFRSFYSKRSSIPCENEIHRFLCM